MKPIYQYKLLISHPSDINEEINYINEIIKKYNEHQGRMDGINIYTVEWGTHTYPMFDYKHEGPQGLINKQLVYECDGVIAIFWNRIGSPTKKHISGTVEEISKMVEAGNDVLIYFCEKPIKNSEIDGKQLEKLQQFKKEYQEKGIYQTYSKPKEFKEKFEQQFKLFIGNEVKSRLNKQLQCNKEDSNLFINRYQHLSSRLIKLLCNKEDVVIKKIFRNSLPYEVAFDFKKRLKNLAPKNKSKCYRVFKLMYKNANNEFIREQCCYYMSYLKNTDSERFLKTIINTENPLLVKRGAYIGLLFATGKIEYLNRYIETLKSNPLAASINAGYHQCHYGDKFPNEGFLYNSLVDSAMTIKGIIGHLGINDCDKLLPLDLYTLKYLITYNSKDIMDGNQLNSIIDKLNKINTLKNLNSHLVKAIDDYIDFIDNIFKINDDEYITCDYCIKKLPNRRSQEIIIYNYISKVYIDNNFYDVHNHDLKEFSENFDNDKEKFSKLFNTISKLDIFDNEKNMNLLDIGCGYGAFINIWKNNNRGEVCGIELSQQAKKLSKTIFDTNLDIITCDAYDIEKEINKRFPDIISCFDFIEHVFNVELLLYRLSKAVKTGTYILIYVPIIDEEIFNNPIEKLPNYKYFHQNHIYYFTKEGLIEIFNKYGFVSCKIEEIKTYKYLYVFQKE